MELRHMRYFVAVAEHLHFGRAAEALVTAQPSLSKQIHDLEAELGVKLFDRSNRRVTLTDAGRRFLEDAKAILQSTEASLRRAREGAEGTRGELRIGFRPDAMFAELPSLLRTFSERFPDVELKLTKIQNREYVHGLVDDRFDFAWVVPTDDERIETHAVSIENLVAAVPMSHPLSALPCINIDDLSGEAMVMPGRTFSPVFHDAVMAIFRMRNVTPSRFIDAYDEVTSLGLVAAGLGIALVPSSWSRIGVNDVVFRDLDSRFGFEEALCWLRGRETPAMRAFIELVRAQPAGVDPDSDLTTYRDVRSGSTAAVA
jgi:DNA-binding transcriptional LysR family regulator